MEYFFNSSIHMNRSKKLSVNHSLFNTLMQVIDTLFIMYIYYKAGFVVGKELHISVQ